MWTWLGGAIAATAGHAFSYHRRHQSLGVWPAVIALMLVGLALFMRSEILAALDGNWLPLAHYLLLVQAISRFDLRTRGGLYAGFALSGIVLFFASQQAFDLSFGIFLLGYAALLMGFLARATLEDAFSNTTGTPAYKTGRQLGFWSGTAVAVLMFSVAAFLLLPRGESNATGYQQVSALPITAGADLLPDQGVCGGPSDAGPTESVLGDGQRDSGNQALQSTDSDLGSSPDSGKAVGPPVGQKELTAPGSISTTEGEGVVMRVRSPVASYWRGQVYDRFDGNTWQPDTGRGGHRDPGQVPRRARRYAQTFFVERVNPGTTYLGYRGVEVVFPHNSAYAASLGTGFSYRVVSVAPELDPVALGRDTPSATGAQYYTIPESMGWLRSLARELTAEAETGIDKALSIVEYVRLRARYDPSAPYQLESTAPVDAVLLEGRPATGMDLATATVLLARGAGLPTHLATGYLPEERDLLSGAYTVRERDAHAWAEIRFRDHGWVPFDGSDRADPYATGGHAARGKIPVLKHLFESSVGDDLVRGVAQAPSRLSAGLAEAFRGPIRASIAALVAGAGIMALVWFSLRLPS